MKKYITAAALIAAGTALSSAASYCPWPENGSSLNGADFNAQEIRLSSLGFESGKSYTLESLIFPRVSGSLGLGGILAILDASDYSVLGYATGFSNQSGQTFGDQSNKAVTTYLFTYGGNGTTLAPSVMPTLKAEETYLAVWVAAGSELTAGQAIPSTATIVTPKSSSNGGMVYSSVNDSRANTYGAAKSVSVDSSGNMTVSDYLSNGTKVLATYGVNATMVVPEPSAFGLLAGVGALALVAARRRRSK